MRQAAEDLCRAPTQPGCAGHLGDKKGCSQGDSIPVISRQKKGGVARRPGRPPKRGWRNRFLWALAETGSKVKAARQARVARSTVGEWERADPAFRKAVVTAKQDWRVQRAQTRYGKDPSQGNMIRLLAAMRPEQYGWAVKRPSRPRPERQPKTDPAALLREMFRAQEEQRGGPNNA